MVLNDLLCADMSFKKLFAHSACMQWFI